MVQISPIIDEPTKPLGIMHKTEYIPRAVVTLDLIGQYV